MESSHQYTIFGRNKIMPPAVVRPERERTNVGDDGSDSPTNSNSSSSSVIRRAASISEESRDTSLPCHHEDATAMTSSAAALPLGVLVPATSPKSADSLSLSTLAEAELAELYQDALSHGIDRTHSFPVACRALLLDMEGNTRCIDCGKQTPEWAAVSYGAMVCLHCAGSHRGLGVTVSTVRSVTMDHWRYQEIVKMLEGGNRQLSTFFQRHALGRECVEFQSPQLNSQNVANMRYKTKAALFYRQQLEHHVEHLLQQGPYQGRRRTPTTTATTAAGARTKRRTLGTQASDLE